MALAACTSDPINTDTLPAPSDPRQGIVVPVEEALQELDGLMQALAQHTRAGETSDHRKAIREVRVSGGTKAIYDCLQQKKPVWIEGYRSEIGHAWVIDGFYKFQQTVTQTVRYSPSQPIATQTFTEEQRLLHYNWGYPRRYDGYFTEGVFDMAQRAFYYPPFDPENAKPGDKNYNLHNRVILY